MALGSIDIHRIYNNLILATLKGYLSLILYLCNNSLYFYNNNCLDVIIIVINYVFKKAVSSGNVHHVI